jgi:hypothetical protein
LQQLASPANRLDDLLHASAIYIVGEPHFVLIVGLELIVVREETDKEEWLRSSEWMIHLLNVLPSDLAFSHSEEGRQCDYLHERWKQVSMDKI